MKLLRHVILKTLPLVCALLCAGCMSMDYLDEEDFDRAGRGLFIVNQGNFQYGNSTLSYYDPSTGLAENEVFVRANSQKLGDTAQSMTIYDGTGWIVVNNSHVIFAIDVDNFKIKGHIEGFTSPRYIHFVSATKAYVTQLYDNRIAVINPRERVITGYIEVPGMSMGSGSTERMVQVGGYVYVTCWSYDNRVLKIDTATDCVVETVEVGVQPRGIVADYLGRLWVLTDGGYAGSPYGYEAPRLLRLSTDPLAVEREWRFELGSSPGGLTANGDATAIYWLDGGVWRMDVQSVRLPSEPVVPGGNPLYYGMTVDPDNGQIYVADAIDYQQQGIVSRYTAGGELLERFAVGVNPGEFCWKP